MIANLIKQLEQEGELENTFIFYFGDHGGVLPGSKGYVFERGLSVPLVIRIPENFKHLVSTDLQKENTDVSGLVSFIDFAPTVLELAAIESPKEYPGKSFLAPNTSLEDLNKRDEVYAQADRFDENLIWYAASARAILSIFAIISPTIPTDSKTFTVTSNKFTGMARPVFRREAKRPTSGFF